MNTDLLSLIGHYTRLRRVASTNGGEWAGACPWCGGRDRFRVWPTPPDGRPRWWCRQCERHGDAIDFLRQRDGLTYREALERLGQSLLGRPFSPAVPERVPEPPPPDIRQVMRAISKEGECLLWSKAGKRAREWLALRGLQEETMRNWHIGYCATDRWVSGIFVPRGIIIPCTVGGEIWYLKVRRPAPPLPGPKYQMVKGSRAAIYGLDHLTGKPVVVFCEGELDGLLLWQSVRDLVDVVALGSATTRPHPFFLAHLIAANHWLIATDRDKAGEQGASRWAEFSHLVQRVTVPQGNDITDFYLAGGNLRSWVEGLLEQIGV